MNSRAQAEVRVTPQRDPSANRVTLRELISDATASACREAFDSRIESLILTGSLARDEATFAHENGETLLRGDVEFLLVFPGKRSLPRESELAAATNVIEQALAKKRLRAHVDLSAVTPSYFRNLPPQIFSLELRECGRVILGDDRFLKMIPRFAAADLDREDAWRLLCNRLIETLEFAPRAAEPLSETPKELAYRLAKLYLDMTTSFLIFKNSYSSSYRERCEKLLELTKRAPKEAFPFELRQFAEMVQQATAAKLSSSDFHASWQITMDYAHQLWRWELIQLTGADAALADADLLEAWMQQPFRKRLRGWAYVIRAQGWLKSVGQWPRWLKLALRASPRHWIYRAAAEAAFGRVDVSLDDSKLRSFLPAECPHSAEGRIDSLERMIVWNYFQFLKGTRA